MGHLSMEGSDTASILLPSHLSRGAQRARIDNPHPSGHDMSDRAIIFLVILLLLPTATALGPNAEESKQNSSTTGVGSQIAITTGIVAHLSHRDILLDPLPTIGEFDGTWILGRQGPLPTPWLHDLQDSGADCNTFVPPSSFLCHLNQMNAAELQALGVIAVGRLEPKDKLDDRVTPLLAGIINQPFFGEGVGMWTVVFTHEAPDSSHLPRGKGLSWLSIGERIGTVEADQSGIEKLSQSDLIEWIEPKALRIRLNDVAREVMGLDTIANSSWVQQYQQNWSGLDGSGVQVTVADTGLDSGADDADMHPDFKGRITNITSFPIDSSWSGYLDNTNLDDGASDLDSGHGTHVAGSVLGDGNHSGWTIMGAAPEASLDFQAIEQYVDWKSNYEDSWEVSDGYSLMGLPDDLTDIFRPAAENGSRVHTNSWGSDVSGKYTSDAMIADINSVDYDELLIVFAAGNAGTDSNHDGEVDFDSIGSPATAKNVLTVGASENNRPQSCNDSGSCSDVFKWNSFGYGADPLKTDRSADDIEGMAAFSSRGPTSDGRVKPDISAPGTWILSTKSRQTTDEGWGGYNSSYTHMGGTSMATPLTAGASALIIEHLLEQRNMSMPSSALVKGLLAGLGVDMQGQYGGHNGAAEIAPNQHEGWGRVDLQGLLNATLLDREQVSTGESHPYTFTLTGNVSDLRVMASWTDPASSPAVAYNLVNRIDISLVAPDGTTWSTLNLRNNLIGLRVSNATNGTWTVWVNGTDVPVGPQNVSLVINAPANLTHIDPDLDGIIDPSDDCPMVAGTSIADLDGCPDDDGDGWSNTGDAFPNNVSEWGDLDVDGIGDNSDDDIDGDMWNQTEEWACQTDPWNASNKPTDTDNDSLCDWIDLDDDDDMWSDVNEILCSTDPLNNASTPSDTDNDTLCDWIDADDDDDGITDVNDLFPKNANESRDHDDDGIGDNSDSDDDGDAWSDENELLCFTDARDNKSIPSDIDGDQICDPLDQDDDGDTWLDGDEMRCLTDPTNNTSVPPDIDGDGLCSVLDEDDDGDGWTDIGEIMCMADPLNESSTPSDVDGDGICNLIDGDDDDDGWGDMSEEACLNDPLDVDDRPADSDTDGICDALEVDDDDDGWLDGQEIICGSDPLSADSLPTDLDGDRICDAVETDSDGDGWLDTQELACGTDRRDSAKTPVDTDGDMVCDVLDADSDADQWTDLEEELCGSHRLDPRSTPDDTDGDGICDVLEVDTDGDGWSDVEETMCLTNVTDSDEMPSDIDKDGVCDGQDIDADQDGWSDTDEIACGTDPLSATNLPNDLDMDGRCDSLDGDLDGDGRTNEFDDCAALNGTSWIDRVGCPDSDGDGRSDPDSTWGVEDGADAAIEEPNIAQADIDKAAAAQLEDENGLPGFTLTITLAACFAAVYTTRPARRSHHVREN